MVHVAMYMYLSTISQLYGVHGRRDCGDHLPSKPGGFCREILHKDVIMCFGLSLSAWILCRIYCLRRILLFYDRSALVWANLVLPTSNPSPEKR